jgi:hypothetical protein
VELHHHTLITRSVILSPHPYFEADPPFPEGNKRRHGYSRDHRSDYVQVIIALTVTPKGLPLAHEVPPGNTADNTTLRAFRDRIGRQYGKARRIQLMDRPVPTEAMLAEMLAADPPLQYLVGTPKGRLTQLEKALIASLGCTPGPGCAKPAPANGPKWLWGRLKQLAGMKLNREELLMRLGAARKQARTA